MEVVVSDRATDGLTDKIEVKVLATNVNEPPVITRTTGDDTLSYPENTATTRVLRRYTASDPDQGDSITWSVEGTDGGDFTIDTSGNLRFASQPDHETTASYSITIVATDDGDPEQKAELPVTVPVADVDEPPEITGEDTLSFLENTSTTHILQNFSASDPEGVTNIIYWSLSGSDSGDFEISESGELTFKNVPDYDRPADSGGNNEYNVTVLATDDATPAKTGRLNVTITATDVNEPPVITGEAAPSFNENRTGRIGRYQATDPEGDSFTWSVSGSEKDNFSIDSSGYLSFKITPNFEAKSNYFVSIVAADTKNLPGHFDVRLTIVDVDEPPVITGATTFDNWQENDHSTIGTYTATDPEGDTPVTWGLGGTDRGDFDITDGVLSFKNAPDYERPADSGGNNHYEVTVQATDSNNKRGQQHVDVIVKNVDEPPVITGPDTVDDFPENSSTSRQVGRYTASDPEGATVTLGLSSGDADFTLARNGVLTFKASPDYEDQNTYSVTVRAVAGSHTVDKAVTVNIQNVEEPGAVTLSTVQPQAETPLTATLEDDDIPSSTEWQWYRTSSRGSTGTSITNATSSSYTPVDDDVGRYLRVVAAYDDGHGDEKTAPAVSANRVQEAPPQPEPPVFDANADYGRSIRENRPADRNVGAPVTAIDANNDRLTYTTGTSDYFEIVAATGQLRTKAELNHEDQPNHTVTVTATDPSNLTDTITVIISVEDVDETPVVTGPATVDFAEGGTGTVATYSSTDPDRKGIEWVLTGNDSDSFTLAGGALAIDAAPDYEEKNQYRVTIEAREQGDGVSVARLDVTVRVTNLDEPGTVEANVKAPRVGQQLTPTLTDPDGGVNSVEWKWERRESGGSWTSIPGGTSRSYTPARDDDGKELRVVVIYRDREGPGKTYTHVFASAVALRPYFEADNATRTLRENTPEDRNVDARFTARHPDNVDLTYSFGGPDARFFTVDSTNGQLQTSATPLDYESLSDHRAMVQLTATDPNSQTANITVIITVTDECQSAGEPPCPPGRPGVSSATDTSLRVSWSIPGTPSGTSITGYELQYRESGGNDFWTPETATGTGRSHTIENLTKGTAYEVQVRASNDISGYGEWSKSGTGTPGYVPPPPPPDPEPEEPTTITTTTTTTTTVGGGGGGGGFAPPTPPTPPRATSNFQPVGQLFEPLTRNATLGRVWRLIESSQRWLFYDPRPELAPFNTLRTVNLASDPPAVVAINVTRNQQFRGFSLYAGWNFVPVAAEPLSPQPGNRPQAVQQLVRPLINGGVLLRVWWLDSRTQEWKFFDPKPEFAAFNTLTAIDLAANPPTVLAVSVDRRTEFRGRTLYSGWNYVVMR